MWVRRNRQHSAHPQQSAAHTPLGQVDSNGLLAKLTFDAVVSRQPAIDIGEVGIDQVQQRTIVGEQILEEENRLVLHPAL